MTVNRGGGPDGRQGQVRPPDDERLSVAASVRAGGEELSASVRGRQRQSDGLPAQALAVIHAVSPEATLIVEYAATGGQVIQSRQFHGSNSSILWRGARRSGSGRPAYLRTARSITSGSMPRRLRCA